MSIDIERLKIDPAYWDEVAPEGATHALNLVGDVSYYKYRMMSYGHTYELLTDGGRIVKNFDFYRDMPHESDLALLRRPTVSPASVITDAQAEKLGSETGIPVSVGKYPHYFKDVSDVDAIDLYHVAKLYEINDPCLFHAFKKIACAGKRGAKDQAQDIQESIDALKRWLELNK